MGPAGTGLRPLVAEAPPGAVVGPIAQLLRARLEEAEAGVFDLLGSGPVAWTLSEPRAVNRANRAVSAEVLAVRGEGLALLDWHRDPARSVSWDPATWHRDIGYGVADGSGVIGDVKLPWELSRCQHLPMLALLATDPALRARCGAVFRAHVLDFVASAPPRFGVPWACTMDAAIRAANWAIAWSVLDACGWRGDAAFLSVFEGSLDAHAAFIATHLEWDPVVRANHYLADIAGLAVVAAVLPISDRQRSWLSFAGRELMAEIRRQFQDDGSNFEASTCYHRLSLEMATFGVLGFDAGSRSDIDAVAAARWGGFRPGAASSALVSRMTADGTPSLVLSDVVDRIAKGAVFTRWLLDAEGTAPQIGDNDAGRFVALTPERAGAERDHRGCVDAVDGAVGATGTSARAEGWLAAAMAGGRFARALGLEPADDAFGNFGLWALRRGCGRVFFRAGHLGQDGNGGHAHNDQLSFVLEVAGRRVIDDPGTGVYTSDPAARVAFRSVGSHSTAAVEGLEQADTGFGLFAMRERDRARVVSRVDAHDSARIVGEHDGMGVRHCRSLVLRDGVLLGVDEVGWFGDATRVVRFHVPAGFDVRGDGKDAAVVHGHGISMTIEAVDGALDVVVEASRYSPTYGVVVPASCVVMRLLADAEALRWRVAWTGGA